jgi:cytochrome b pre-mRNA-processing protein 3
VILLNQSRKVAGQLYAKAVDAARAPAFYRDLGVPDTIEGRYEMIVLHVVLLLRRLRADRTRQARLAQAVVDYMAADLDRSMRELGIGDLSVGRFMKRLGEGLYGRAAAYDKALDEEDGPALEAALVRNIFDAERPGDRILAIIAGYVHNQLRHLDGQPIADIAAGTVDFMPPADIDHDAERPRS